MVERDHMRTCEPQTAAPASAATAGKYIPKHRRVEGSSQAPPSEPDRWIPGRGDGRGGDRWRSDRGASSRPTAPCPLIDWYGKCGVVWDAQKLFDEMSQRNVAAQICNAKGYFLELRDWKLQRIFR
ncbi:hypothetical protein QQ045_030520 [Rhodiola kirilowii]